MSMISTIKTRRAARLCDLSRHPRTWSALLSRIPADVMQSLTSAQIAAMFRSLYAQYTSGHTAGWREAQ